MMFLLVPLALVFTATRVPAAASPEPRLAPHACRRPLHFHRLVGREYRKEQPMLCMPVFLA